MKYQEIAKDMASKINNGFYTDRLPSEADLMEKYATSRNTIKNALDALYNQGVIKRVQGSGCFVNRPLHGRKNVINMANKVGFKELATNFSLKSKVLKLEVIPAGEEISGYLGCSEDDLVYRVKRLRFNEDEVFSLEDAYYLKSIVPYLFKEACEQSIFKFIEEVYEIDIRSGDEYISVHELTQAEAQASESNVGQAVMSIEEINYLKNNIAFNYSRTYYFRKNFTAYFHIGNYLR